MRADKLWRALDRFRADPGAWVKNTWFRRRSFSGEISRCLAGELLGLSTEFQMGDLHRVDADPECQLVAEIILEHFPERTDPRNCNCSDCSPEGRKDWCAPSKVIPSFNDHSSTTYEDVLLVLEKAAIQCDEVLS